MSFSGAETSATETSANLSQRAETRARVLHGESDGGYAPPSRANSTTCELQVYVPNKKFCQLNQQEPLHEELPSQTVACRVYRPRPALQDGSSTWPTLNSQSVACCDVLTVMYVCSNGVSYLIQSTPMVSRIALIRCFALAQVREVDSQFTCVQSVSVKVDETSTATAFVETVTACTKRHAALWQDAAQWTNSNALWYPRELIDTRWHLLEIFRLAQLFCSCGVRAHHRTCACCPITPTFVRTHHFT